MGEGQDWLNFEERLQSSEFGMAATDATGGGERGRNPKGLVWCAASASGGGGAHASTASRSL